MLNLGLSIFNKIQTMQHRQIKIANELSKDRSRNRQLSSHGSESDVHEVEILKQNFNNKDI